MINHENSTIVDGFTLEMVLEDKVPSPFSLKDFINYLNQTFCTENLAFYQAVERYRSTSQFFFCPTTLRQEHDEDKVKSTLSSSSSSSLPTSVRLINGHYFTFHKNQYHLLAPDEQSCFDYMMMQFDTIMDQFIQINANQEINIPADMKQQLLINAHQHHCYHPSLLAPAYSSILELLRISAFIPFITDPQRLALFSNGLPMFSVQSSFSSNFTFVSTSSSISTTSSLSSSTSLASSASPTAQRPSYFYRSSSNPSQSPPPIFVPPTTTLPCPWNLRRLKSSPSLNSMLPPTSSIPPLPTTSISITCRSSTEDTLCHLSPPRHRPRSIHSQTDSTTDTDELNKPFLKKITSSFRRTPSPHNRSGGWRQINVHDSPLFKQSYLVNQHPS